MVGEHAAHAAAHWRNGSVLDFYDAPNTGGGGKMMSFGKAKIKPANSGKRITFADVAGAR